MFTKKDAQAAVMEFFTKEAEDRKELAKCFCENSISPTIAKLSKKGICSTAIVLPPQFIGCKDEILAYLKQAGYEPTMNGRTTIEVTWYLQQK